eukprot:45451_1
MALIASQEEKQLLSINDEQEIDDVSVDLLVPGQEKHNYHASRIVLPPMEALEFNKTVEREIDIEEAQLDEEIDGYNKFIDVFGYMIPYIYGVFFTVLLGLYVTGFVQKVWKQYLIWGMIGLLFLGSLLGMYAVYKYGVIDDHIDDMKIQNDDYKNELKKLKRQNEKFKTEVKGLKTTVSELEHDAQKLAEQTDKFEGLVGELKEISKENDDINNILDDTNKIFADMKKVVLENERAHLLTAFYECAFRDDDNAMDKKEYMRFLVRLTKKQRLRFQELGNFEQLADETGHINIDKFQDILEIVLEDVDKLLQEEFETHAEESHGG